MSYSMIQGLSEKEKKTFIDFVENTDDFENYEYGDYAAAIQYHMYDRQKIIWGARHEHGYEYEKEWIQNVMEACAYDGMYGELIDCDYDEYFGNIEKELNEFNGTRFIDGPEYAELDAHFEKGDAKKYINASGGKISSSSDILWLARHEYGTEEQKRWIEGMYDELGKKTLSQILKDEDYDAAYEKIEEGLLTHDRYSMIELDGAAFLRKSGDVSFFKMPNDGDHDGFVYNILNKDLAYPAETVGKPDAVPSALNLHPDDEIVIKHPDKASRVLPAQLFEKYIDGKTAKDYLLPALDVKFPSKDAGVREK